MTAPLDKRVKKTSRIPIEGIQMSSHQNRREMPIEELHIIQNSKNIMPLYVCQRDGERMVSDETEQPSRCEEHEGLAYHNQRLRNHLVYNG